MTKEKFDPNIIGEKIIKTIRMAVNKINEKKKEIITRDTK